MPISSPGSRTKPARFWPATLPLSTVNDYAETKLGQQISQLPGVAQVDVYGSQRFAIRVQVDPVAAAARNISLDDIRRVIAQTNSNAPVGTIYTPRQNITLSATAAMRASKTVQANPPGWRRTSAACSE